VEVSTGIIFALLGNYFFQVTNFSTWISTGYYLIIFSILMIIFVYDFKYMEIPMLVLWLGIGISLVYFVFSDYYIFKHTVSIFDLRLVSGILGGLIAGGFFYGLAAYSKEIWMGYGDAYLGLLAGLIVGWSDIFLVLLLSFTIGAVVSVILVTTSKKTMKSQVPFAPFLICGIFLVLLLPQMFPQFQYYFSLFS
jgi:leader peptidase (prepilin peptidase)/N-methyltransferase